MRIEINNDSVCLGNDRVINMQEFTELYESFVGYRTGKDTAEIEEEGKSLLKGDLDLSKANQINAFVSRVIIWGEENRRGIIHRRVFPSDKQGEDKAEHEAEVAKIVTESAIFLRNGDLKSAIDRIKDVYGFCFSYGSKVLRMLSPEKAGAYDSILSEKFPAYRGIEGYVEFCDACQKVADALKERDIKSHRKNDEWYVADVEATIYHYIRHYKDEAKIKND